jgi:hypothetical protein
VFLQNLIASSKEVFLSLRAGRSFIQLSIWGEIGEKRLLLQRAGCAQSGAKAKVFNRVLIFTAHESLIDGGKTT